NEIGTHIGPRDQRLPKPGEGVPKLLRAGSRVNSTFGLFHRKMWGIYKGSIVDVKAVKGGFSPHYVVFEARNYLSKQLRRRKLPPSGGPHEDGTKRRKTGTDS